MYCDRSRRLGKGLGRNTRNCIVTKVAGWLGFVSQYTAVYCDQQGLAAGETVSQYIVVYCDQEGLEAAGHCVTTRPRHDRACARHTATTLPPGLRHGRGARPRHGTGGTTTWHAWVRPVRAG